MLAWLKDRPTTGDREFPEAVQQAAPLIRFLCAPEDEGVIAPPVAAKRVIPDWFKRLPAVRTDDLSPTNNGLTVKRCMPFLDAMTMGWVIPLAATVRIEISGNGSEINCGWDFDKELISPHGVNQVEGHPALPMPPMKFHNYWTVATPPGWSCLFVPPLNRAQPVFEIASGVVDTDSYTSLIHFPFFAKAPDGLYTIERGTPIAQVIPFLRDQSGLAIEADIRSETPDEAATRERIRRSTMASEGWYREQARAPR